MTTTVKTAEVKEAEVKTADEPIVDVKPGLKDRIVNSRPVGWVRKHAKGVAAGAAAAVAVGAAAVLVGRQISDASLDVPFDVDGIADAIPTGGDAD